MLPTRDAGLLAGADLALQAGLNEDSVAVELFGAGCRADVLHRYEHTHSESHLLRVQAAFLQPAIGGDRALRPARYVNARCHSAT